MEMYNTHREQERIREIFEAREKLVSYLLPPYHLSPEDKIDHATYKDATKEGKELLEKQMYNMMRKNWFAYVLGNIQMCLEFLPESQSQQIAEKERSLRTRIKEVENTTVELVNEAQELIKIVTSLLDTQLHGAQSDELRAA